MNEKMTALLPNDTFNFACHSKIPCFNHCCRDLNQFLTPYDILRLKKHLNLSATEFHRQYTTQHVGPETGFPIITLRPKGRELICPFSEPSGCLVYADRPSSCRTYPLARIAGKSKETGGLIEHYILLEEPHCEGFKQNKRQTVKDWIDEQEIAPYNQLNDLLMEIIGLKTRLRPGPLDMKQNRLFHLACYDLDEFKTNVFQNDLLKNYDVDSSTLALAREDDVELLKLGLNWLKHTLFNAEG